MPRGREIPIVLYPRPSERAAHRPGGLAGWPRAAGGGPAARRRRRWRAACGTSEKQARHGFHNRPIAGLRRRQALRSISPSSATSTRTCAGPSGFSSKSRRIAFPSIIRKQAPHLPKHIRPVFRDQTDISTGPLLQNLRQELQDSRFLIVLCSPAAAKSEWVNREVQHFIDMGRADRIIPFVVAGTPNAANPDEECFPAILRGAEQAMLGVSVPELGKEKAFVKVVAKLLGLKFDQLWDRHRRRQRRQRLFRGLMAVALLVAAAIGGFAYWDYHRTKIAYYADYVECRGVPQGIGELSAAQVQRRDLSWKFESSRYRVDRVCSINGSGRVCQPADTEDADRPADRSFHYRDNGKLEYTIEFTPTGKELRKSVYAPDLSIVEFKGGSKGRLQMQAQFLPADAEGFSSGRGTPETGGRSEIAAWELKYDDLGRVVRRTYLNQSGYPTSDANGIYVQEFTYTPAGKVKAIRYLDVGGQPCPTKRGIAGKQYEYDAQGNRIQTTWIGSDGNTGPQ